MVRDLMQSEVMLKKRIGCLPVLDGDALAGLLSETDRLRYVAQVPELPEIKQRLPLLRQA